MSCRKNDGNSAVTSLARFLTRSDDTTVSHLFHVAYREARARHGSEHTAPADQGDVLAFLAEAEATARHDSRIPAVRRAHLLDRIEKATRAAQNGDLPTRASFTAWTQLRDRLETHAAKAVPAEQTAGYTPEGVAITRADVDLAAADYQRLAADADRGDAKMRAVEIAAARDRFERLTSAYDATDPGFEALLVDPAGDPDHPDHATWAARKAAASTAREMPNAISAAREAAAALGTERANEAWQAARTAADTAEAAYRLTPTARKKALYERAAATAAAHRRVYLYTLLDRPAAAVSTKGFDLRSPQAWASVTGASSDVPREEMWSALDLHARDTDNAEVRVGKISDVEANRRAYSRAEARQALLDSEGRGQVDPVNRRFAELLRRKRSLAVA